MKIELTRFVSTASN